MQRPSIPPNRKNSTPPRLNTATRLLFIVLSFFLIVLVVTSGYFFFKFYHYEFSNDVEQWGQTGDYFGGFLNPVIGLMNLFVTSYIAWELHRFNDKQAQRDIDNFNRQLSEQRSQATRQILEQRATLRRQVKFETIKNFNTEFLTAYRIAMTQMLNSGSTPKIQVAIIHLSRIVANFRVIGKITFDVLRNNVSLFDNLSAAIDKWFDMNNVNDSSIATEVEGQFSKLVEEVYKEMLIPKDIGVS